MRREEENEMCWPWNHKWSKWAVIGEGKLARALQPVVIVGYYIEQRRECSECGKIQMREVRV